MKPEAILDHAASHCLNCATSTAGNFCQQCGQEIALHVPSAREFLHEFVGHYVALEGKLWQSLGLLLFRPGRLTREYIEGRRVRYVLPLRLYLTFSIIFFALFKYGGHPPVQFDAEDEQPRAEVHARDKGEKKQDITTIQAAGDDTDARAGDDAGDDAKAGNTTAGLASKNEARQILGSRSPKLAAKVDKFSGLSKQEKSRLLQAAFFSYAPYAIFALMPVFALFLKLLYLGSGRRYGEHLLFALHSNAFAFLTLSLLIVIPNAISFVRPLLGLWLLFYLPSAMRKVYGGSRKLTLVRWMVLMTLHMVSIGLAIIAAFALAIVA